MPISLAAKEKQNYLANLAEAFRTSYVLAADFVEIKDSFKRISNLFKLLSFDESLHAGRYTTLEINPYSGFPTEHTINRLVDDVAFCQRVTYEAGTDEDFLQVLKQYIVDPSKNLEQVRKGYSEKKYMQQIKGAGASKNFINKIPEVMQEQGRIVIADFLDDCFEVVEILHGNDKAAKGVGKVFEDRYNLHRPRTTKQIANYLAKNQGFAPESIRRFLLGPFTFAQNKDYSASPSNIMNGDPSSYVLHVTYDRLRKNNEIGETQGNIPVKFGIPKKFLIVSPDVSMNLNKATLQEYDCIVGGQNER